MAKHDLPTVSLGKMAIKDARVNVTHAAMTDSRANRRGAVRRWGRRR
jgi:hypothetical protein